MAGLFARLFVWDYAVFHPLKDKMFHFYTLIKSELHFLGI